MGHIYFFPKTNVCLLLWLMYKIWFGMHWHTHALVNRKSITWSHRAVPYQIVPVWRLIKKIKIENKNKIKKFKDVAIPRSSLTGSEIRACLKDRLLHTKEKFSLTSAVTTDIARTFFSQLLVTHMRAKSWALQQIVCPISSRHC